MIELRYLTKHLGLLGGWGTGTREGLPRAFRQETLAVTPLPPAGRPLRPRDPDKLPASGLLHGGS